MIYLEVSLVITKINGSVSVILLQGWLFAACNHVHTIARLRVKQKETSGQSVDFFSWLRICYCQNKYYTHVLLLSYFIKNRIWKSYIAKIIAVSYFGARFGKVLNMPWVLNMSRFYIFFWICVWPFSGCQSFCAIASYGLAGLSKILW